MYTLSLYKLIPYLITRYIYIMILLGGHPLIFILILVIKRYPY